MKTYTQVEIVTLNFQKYFQLLESVIFKNINPQMLLYYNICVTVSDPPEMKCDSVCYKMEFTVAL